MPNTSVAVLNYLVFEKKHLAFCRSMQYNKAEELSKRCFLIVLFDHHPQIIKNNKIR